jgi:CheY-like chemotaxis protein
MMNARKLNELQLLGPNFLWLLHRVDNPIICLTLNYKVLAVNLSAAQLFKVSRQDLLQKSFSRLLKKLELTDDLPKDPARLEIDKIIFKAINSNPEYRDLAQWEWFVQKLMTKTENVYGLMLVGRQSEQRSTSLLMTKTFNLRTLIEDINELMILRAKQKNLTLTIQYDPEAPEVFSGFQQPLYRVLFSLVNNAIKYTQKGYVLIQVKLLKLEENLATIKLIVQDTGIGFASMDYRHIFEQRRKVNLEEDMDLDLYAIKQLVQMMQGKISVENNSQQGSLIALTLPLSVVKSESAKPINEKSKKAEISQVAETCSAVLPSSRAFKVLVIEDDPVCQNVLKTFLTQMGYTVDLTETAQQTLELLKNKYDVLLVDIGLPDRDGLTLMREIRFHLHHAIPAVAMTGYEWDKEEYFEAGFNELLKKPISREKLQHVLFRILSPTHP